MVALMTNKAQTICYLFQEQLNSMQLCLFLIGESNELHLSSTHKF